MARLSVTRFLQDPNEVDWRLAHGVRAASVDQLRPLSDPRDAALCARLDSAIVRGPASYFRVARYIVAATADPPRDTTMMMLLPSWAPHILVFDETGNFVHLAGLAYGVNGDDPFRLAVSNAADGRVALKWSRRARGSTPRARLQRAVDNGPFVDLTRTLDARDSVVIDSAVTAGHRYHYRLLEIEADGRRGIHSSARSVALTDVGILTRRVSGLLYRSSRETANATLAPQWSVESGAWSIRRGGLEAVVDRDKPAVIRLADVAPRRDMRVQVVVLRTRPTDRVTVVARRSVAESHRLSIGATDDRADSGEARLTRVVADSVFDVARATARSLAATRLQLVYSLDWARHAFWANGQDWEAGDQGNGTFPPGQVALEVSGGRTGDVVRFEDVVVTGGRYIKVRNLPGGYNIRIADIGAPGVDWWRSSGDVTADVWGRTSPLERLQIIDPHGTIIKTYRPEGGIWGGDEFEFSPSAEFLASREVDSLSNYVGQPRVPAHAGLPTLQAIALPRGSREYRIALHCGACLPEYVVRLRQTAGMPATGEAYMAWFDPDEAKELDNDNPNAKAIRTPPKACTGPLRPVLGHRWWCPVMLAHGATWDQVLHRLAELGVLMVGSPNGYAPGPPGSEKGFAEGLRGCQDVGGMGLDIASLDGRQFRRAGFECLDKQGPPGSEHARMGEAYRFLASVLPR